MYMPTCIFSKRQFDAEFHKLDDAIAVSAMAIRGNLGEETWKNLETGLVSNFYCWHSRQALQQLMRDPTHLLAKATHAKWLNSYRVIIAEVQKEYCLKGLGRGSPAR